MFCRSVYYVGFISLLWPISTDISAFQEFHWMLYPLKSIYVKDCIKVASSKLVNPYHEFTISFGKGVGMAMWVKWNILVRHEVFFLRLSLLWGFSEDALYLDTIRCYFAFLSIDIFVFFTRYSLRYFSLKLIIIHLIVVILQSLWYSLLLRKNLFVLARRTTAIVLWAKLFGCEKLNKSDFKLLCFA